MICALVVTGCGGGGGGSLGSPIPMGSFVTGGSSTSPSNGSSTGTSGPGSTSTGSSGTSNSAGSGATGNTVPCCADTGITGSVEAPATASFGASPLPAQIATPGGPTFDGKSGSYPSGDVSFPALSSSLQSTSSGLSAVSTNQSATVTVSTSAASSFVQLTVPSVNLNATWSESVNLVSYMGDEPTYGLSYVVLGTWYQRDGSGNSGNVRNVTEFAFGYETPATSMPTTGQATFSGYADANIFTPVGGHILSAWASGNAAFSADFASGKITGAFTHMQYPNPLGGLPLTSSPWNDVSVNASIAAKTNRFSGSTAVTSAPQTPFSLNGSATGHIDGAFYGPAAQNLGAIWSLSDGTTSAIGGVAAGR